MADFEVVFIDVGQGDCTLIKFPNGDFALVDVYRCPGHGIDIFKLLDDVLPDGDDGKKRLHHLFITHAHDDHITGIGDLYDRYQVEYLWLPQHEDRKQVAKHFEEYQRVEKEHSDEKTFKPQGSRTAISDKYEELNVGDDVTVRCFSPPGYIEIDQDLDEEAAKKLIHANCLVVRIAYNGRAVILTGDSDVVCWKRIVSYYDDRDADETDADVLEAEVLHASHHGSRTFIKENGESSEAWLGGLEAIDPDHVVVSVGDENRHKHPHADMIEAYEDQADEVLETREVGTIVFAVESDDGYTVEADESYADDYAWDDEDDSDDEDDDGGDDSGDPSVSKAAAATIPAAKRPHPGPKPGPPQPPDHGRPRRHG